jgi:hypothetical protein
MAAHNLPFRPVVSETRSPETHDTVEGSSSVMQRLLPKRTGIPDNCAWDDIVSSQRRQQQRVSQEASMPV